MSEPCLAPRASSKMSWPLEDDPMEATRAGGCNACWPSPPRSSQWVPGDASSAKAAAAPAPWHTDAVQEMAVTRRTLDVSASRVLIYVIPRDGDCVGDIDVTVPAGAGPIGVSVHFDDRVLWSGDTSSSARYRLPFGGINMHGTRGHPIYVVLKNVADDEALHPRLAATFRCHEPWAARQALRERSPMRDLLIADW